MAKEPIPIKILIKDAFSGVGPIGWIFILLKPANKGIEMLGEVDLFETYGGAVGRFFDTGIGTFASIIIGTAIIGYAIYKRTHDTTDLRPFAPVVAAQPKIPEQQQIGPAGPTADPIAKPETEKQERVFVPPELTPERLLSFYEENTAIRAAEITNRYIGQWINVSVTVGSVSPFNGHFSQVSRELPPLFERKTSFDYAFIYLLFKKPWVDRLAILNHGDKITAICRIERIDPLLLTLDNCELVDTASK